MKQLLIVTDPQYANVVDGLLNNGSIAFTKPSFNTKSDNALTTKPTENFSIVLGRGNNQNFLIPEVDINSLHVSGAQNEGYSGSYTGSVSLESVTPGNTYTVKLIKLGANVGERSTWTATYTVPLNSTKTAADVVKEWEKQLQGLTEQGIRINTGLDNTIQFDSYDYTKWRIQVADDASDCTVDETQAAPLRIDKDYITDLASQCAAGKGYNYTDCGGTCLYAPEDIPDEKYCLFTLRFQVGRNTGKTRDEKVWQTVHIAVPDVKSGDGSTASLIQTIAAVLGIGQTFRPQ